MTPPKNKHAAWVVYMLRCGDGTLYTGITNDLAVRLDKHAGGTGAKYTRGRGPFKVVHCEAHATKSAALKRERQIKRLSRAKKLALCSDPVGQGAVLRQGHTRRN